ncbi:MAG: HAD hydrolase-like protein [Alphaproteobacteria bacterium]|nr:HAD hydrolase-like protein [Alphaproteobacteria bacterium]
MLPNTVVQNVLPDGVIIDLDGTTTKRGTVARLVDKFGAENAVLRIINASHVSYEALKAAKKALLPVNLRTGALKKGILASIAAPQMSSMPISDFFAETGITSGLLSNNSRLAWGDRLMRHVNFGRGFDHTMYLEDMDGMKKPSPYGAIKMLDQMYPDHETRTVWVVGDMATDMEMAMNTAKYSMHRIVPVAMGNGSARTYLNRLGMLEDRQALTFDDMEDMAAEIFTRMTSGTEVDFAQDNEQPVEGARLVSLG